MMTVTLTFPFVFFSQSANASQENEYNSCHFSYIFGLSGVCALPLAAGINVGGHYKGIFFLFLSSSGSLLILPEGVVVGYQIGLSGVCALPLAAGINEGGHYKWHFFLYSLSLSSSLQLIANSPRRSCCRVLKFCMGS